MAPEAGMECGRAAIPWTLALLRVESVSPACRLDFVACAAALCAPVLTLTLTCRIARLLGASSDQSVVLIFALSIFGAEWEQEDQLGAHLRWEPHAGIHAPSNAFGVR